MLNICEKFLIGISYGLSFPLNLVILDYWLKDIGVSNAIIGMFALLQWPFILKFFWGILFENTAIPLLSKLIGKQRSWLILFHMFLLCGIIGMAHSSPEQGLMSLAIFAFIVALADGGRNVILYPYQKDRVTDKNLGYLASVIGLGHRIGTLFTKVAMLYIANSYGWAAAYQFAAVAIFISLLSILFLSEPDVISYNLESKNIVAWIKNSLIIPCKTMLTKDVIIIIATYKMADFLIQKMSRTFCIDLGFSTTEIANIVQLFGTCAVIVGSFLGGYCVKRIGISKAMLSFGIAHMFSFFTYLLLGYLGKHNLILAIIVFLEGFTGGGVTASFLAFIYKIGSTGTIYATIWAIYETIGICIMSLSGILFEHLGWKYFFLCMPMTSLICLWYLHIKQCR